MPDDRPRIQARLDLMAILTALQDQIDDLTTAVQAQQRTLDALARRTPPARHPGGPARPEIPGRTRG